MAHTVKDLMEEAKKRMVFLFMCIVGLAYLMSLTSSSVWFNMPGAILVIILVRYISYDLDARRRIGGHSSSSTINNLGQSQMLLGNATSPSNPKRINWRHKVDSPVVEASIDQLTRHIVSEWITNLWYKNVTPDQDAPEELINVMNDILGEICMRAKNVNLIDLLTRDIVHLVCEHIELFRMIQAHTGEEELSSLSNDERDARLKLTLAADNKLHPALYSAQAEHKVLQHFMDGVMSFTCKPEDLQCKFFRYAARELLACAVMRPVMNLASPKFINERIVSFILSRSNKDEKHKASESDTKQSKSSRSRASTDHFSGFHDQSISGVELVQIGPKHKKSPSGEIDGAQTVSLSSIHHESKYFPGLSAGYISQSSQQEGNKVTGASLDKSKSLSKSSDVVETDDIICRTIQAHQSPGGNWAQVLDSVSRRKSQALAPEHFENMWTKGRNYKTKEIETGLSKNVNPRSSSEVHDKKDTVRKQSYDQPGNSIITNSSTSERHITFPPQIKQSADDLDKSTKDAGTSKQPLHVLLKQTKVEEPFVHHMELVEDSESSYTSEDDENNTVTGLDTPSVKVWDSKSNRSGSVSHVRHPLENSERDHIKHGSKSQLRYRRPYKSASGRKRARAGQGVDSWQEVERTTFYLGDGRDILNTVHEEAVKNEDQGVESDDQDRIMSGTMTSSSASVACISGTTNSSVRNSQSSHIAATLPYQQLRCKVFGADFVKSGSKTIAVYSISVTDNVNHSWSIKRRFRHFEELHKRLKEFPEYNLHLPPKRFLSSSLDTSFVYERCKLLDKYLKDLLSLPNVADSIEVWDFLSVDSQTYMFSNSLSIIETLSVDLDDKQYGDHFLENFTKKKEEDLHRKQDKSAVRDIDSTNLATIHATEQFRSQAREYEQDNFLNNKKQHEGVHISYLASDLEIGQHKDGRHFKISETRKNDTRSDASVMKDASDIFSTFEGDPSVPSEWTPPNLSIPILNMVDVIFQLQDGGWIRRQAFWVAKQVLQLGMGDAFDDWLIDKIQLLRKGEVIASAIRKIEKILWPDGIFITKHPRRRRTQSTEGNVSVPQNQAIVVSPKGSEIKQIDDKDKPTLSDQQMEETHRANFVRELMIDNAPTALVGLVGRKEYERCARDLYFFLQSAVCVKQLAYGLLELLLLSAFPELHDIVNSCHTEKGSFELFDKSK